jgi:dipeptidyl aminopeptidase/acylaminoacyl peptidase
MFSMPAAVVTAVAVVVALGLATACDGADGARADGATTIVFETGVPGVIDGCDGLWATSTGSRRVRFVAGAAGRSVHEPSLPSFSPDGRTLAFALAGEGYEFDLYAMDVGSGRVEVLASRTGALFLREWSPTSSELLTTRRAAGAKRHELVVLDREGGARMLGPTTGSNLDHAWSPSGTRLAYSTPERKEPSALWILDVASGAKRPIARTDGYATPSWSSDGRLIAFFRDSDVWLVRADGRDLRLLARGPEPGDAGRVVWLPGDRELLVVRDRRDPFDPHLHDVARVDITTGRVVRSLEAVVAIELSPDARELLFLRPHRAVRVPGFAPEKLYSIRVAALDGSDERTVGAVHESNLKHGGVPVWQPSPARIAAAHGQFAPRRSEFCERRLEQFRRRLSR